jgi:hypothetical protein
MQQLGRLRLGADGSQILCPQREPALRQIVGLAHRRALYRRSSGGPSCRAGRQFDEAVGKKRCIVARQHLTSDETADR